MTGRAVYLPPGKWIDYQTDEVYAGGWQQIAAGAVARSRTRARRRRHPSRQARPVHLAQIDWSALDLVVYADAAAEAPGLVALPSDNVLRRLTLARKGARLRLASDPLAGKVGLDGDAAFAPLKSGRKTPEVDA